MNKIDLYVMKLGIKIQCFVLNFIQTNGKFPVNRH